MKVVDASLEVGVNFLAGEGHEQPRLRHDETNLGSEGTSLCDGMGIGSFTAMILYVAASYREAVRAMAAKINRCQDRRFQKAPPVSAGKSRGWRGVRWFDDRSYVHAQSEQYSTDAGSLLNKEQDVFSAGTWEQEGGEEERYGRRLLKKKMARSMAGVAGRPQRCDRRRRQLWRGIRAPGLDVI